MTQKEYINGALEQFAEMLVSKLEKIEKSDWKCPWFTRGALARPVNVRGTGYNGSNTMMLMWYKEAKGYELPVWGTFKQYLELNKKGEKDIICVRKGEKSVPVFYTSYVVRHSKENRTIPLDDYKKLSKEEKEQWYLIPHVSVYSVFNIAQTNMESVNPAMFGEFKSKYGLDSDAVPAVRDGFSIPSADAMLESQSWICPITLQYQNSAYYNFVKDFIKIPERRQFQTEESFYGTLFHEMAHSTGSEKYLNRGLQATDRDAYGREELVAEMTSAFVLSSFGAVKYIKEDSIQYLKGWIDTIRETPEVIKSILTDVRKASELINSELEKAAVARTAA